MKILLLIFILPSCTQTAIFHNGRPVAIIQGDFTGTLSMAADGSATLSGTLNHSEPTRAAGEAATSKINAAGAVVAASLFKP
jgi:hypothetical protein